MANTIIDKDLYRQIRSKGVRKSVARSIAAASDMAQDTGGRAPEALRKAVSDLRSVVSDLEDRATGGPAKRKETAQKAARTRARNAAKRSESAKKAAKTRAKSTGTARAPKSTGTARAAKSTGTARAAKSTGTARAKGTAKSTGTRAKSAGARAKSAGTRAKSPTKRTPARRTAGRN